MLAGIVELPAACCIDVSFDGASCGPPACKLCFVCVAEPALAGGLADVCAAVAWAARQVVHLAAVVHGAGEKVAASVLTEGL